MAHTQAAAVAPVELSIGPLYQYRDLRGNSQIRLLRVGPSTSPGQDDMFLYSIEHHDLDDSLPDYEAVSYVWGDCSKSHHITLRDGSRLLVTSSVVRALPRLTRACRTGYLWIDQVTINQESLPERTQQVQIMGQIYRRSLRCLIWMEDGGMLGTTSESLVGPAWDAGIGDQVRAFLRSHDVEPIQQLGSPQRRRSSSSTSVSLPLITEDDPVREHLLWLLQHPWFTRTWVFQEYVLPRQGVFIIGDFELPARELDNLFRLSFPRNSYWLELLKHRLHLDDQQAGLVWDAPGTEFLLGATQSQQDGLSAMIRQQRTTFHHYESLWFWDILRCNATRQTQDDRDRVYAFLSLAPFLHHHMVVDYTLSTEKVYATTTKAIIQVSRSVDMLEALPCLYAGRSRLTRLPSWAPDWTLPSPQAPILCHDNLFDAAGPGFGLPSVDRCRHYDGMPQATAWYEIALAGKVVDEVLVTLPPYCTHQTTPSIHIKLGDPSASFAWEPETLNKFVDELHRLGVVSPVTATDGGGGGGSGWTGPLLRTLLMDGVQWASLSALGSGLPLYRYGINVIGMRHDEWMAALLPVLTAEAAPPDLDNLPLGASLQVLHELSKVQYTRRVVYCRSGRFALALDTVRPGDIIAIIHGARAPFVLRQNQQPQQRRHQATRRYSFLGQCYYDGAMYGELADPVESNADILYIS